MNFWQHHGWMFLFGMTFFPRLTMLVAGTFHGFGVLSWIGWFVSPHLLVAILATMTYASSNPFLVACAWIMALSGTLSEGSVAKRVRRRRRRGKKRSTS